MPNSTLHDALHHGASVVVFNEAFPAGFRHETGRGGTLVEALLSEVLNCVVVSVCQKIVYLIVACMVFQLVHEPSSISFNLLRGGHRKKYNFSELLFSKRPEYASAQDDWLLTWGLLHNDHRLMHSVHNEAHNVGAWHARELLCDYVFQVNQFAHGVHGSTNSTQDNLLVISDNLELNDALRFLELHVIVPPRSTQTCLSRVRCFIR